MNTFGLVVAALQLAACAESACRRDWRTAVVSLGFSLGSAPIAWRK